MSSSTRSTWSATSSSPALAFAYSVWAIAGAGQDIVTKGFVLLLAGIPVYIGMRWWQARHAPVLPLPPEPVTEEPKVLVGAGDAR